MTNKEKCFVSAVIYVHNAGTRIEEFLSSIINNLEENFEHSEIICVNDSSSDNSVDIIERVSGRSGSVSISVVNMSYYHGLEAAMEAGTDLSIGDFIFEFDNTILDFDQSMIMEIYRRALTGADIVSASPDKKEALSSRIFYSVFDRFSDLKYQMTTESFRILSRRAVNRISSASRSIPYRKAMYAGCGLKTENIKYTITHNDQSRKDVKEKKYRKNLAIDTLILFTRVGYSFSLCMTSMMMFISVFMIIYTLAVYFLGHPIEGWTTTVLFLSVAFLGLFGILTIIVKYLQIIVDMIFKRKHYSYESIQKIR